MRMSKEFSTEAPMFYFVAANSSVGYADDEEELVLRLMRYAHKDVDVRIYKLIGVKTPTELISAKHLS